MACSTCPYRFLVSAMHEDNFIENMVESSGKYCGILHEYCELAAIPELSEKDSERLSQILEEACDDRALGFLLNELDYFIAKKLELLNEDSVADYKDQQAFLREHLNREANSEDNPNYAKSLQQKLQSLNYYTGPIDGVLGNRTKLSLQQFQTSKQLVADGIPSPPIYKLLDKELQEKRYATQ